VLYEAVKLKFERMVGGERCHKYMTRDELRDEAKKRQNGGAALPGLPGLKLDYGGNVCVPRSCSDMEKQCGEWDDGCGRTVICGMCSRGRTGLPATWRVKCVEGQCIDYCPPWDERGYWFLSKGDNKEETTVTTSSSIMKKVMEVMDKPADREYLSPVDAVEICEVACDMTKRRKKDSTKTNTTDSILVELFVDSGLCKCQAITSQILGRDFALHDFSNAHDVKESCRTNRARIEATMSPAETQPVCCSPLLLPPQLALPPGWRRMFSMGQFNLEGEYFYHVDLKCGKFRECEMLARMKRAEIAVFDVYNGMCYLGRNVMDLGNWFPVTKDNANRYAIDLR